VSRRFKLARRLAAGTARIVSATVSRTAGRWFVSFTVQVDRAIPGRHARPGSAIGVDLGVTTLLTGVDDQGHIITVPGPRALRSSLRALRRASRAHSRKAPGSANRRKSAARLARMLGYKTAWHGGRLVLAGRWFPSSKMCSGCGAVKAKLALSERTYRCGCGLVTGRDINAAANLLNLAASGAESLNACGGTVRPGQAGHVPVNQEPGAAQAGQTGTASGQPLAAEQELTHAR
jgi:putative transposase